MSDHPDWTDNNVIASQSQSLFVDTALVAAPCIEVLDCSLFASLDVSIQTQGAATDAPAFVEFTWSISGNVVAIDQFTVWNIETHVNGNGPLISMPCRGDSVTMTVSFAPAGTKVFRVITGSTRAVDKVTVSGGDGFNPGVQVGGLGIAIATAGTKTYYVGPLNGPFDLIMLAVTGAMVLTLLAQYLNPAGVMTAVLIKQVAVPSGTSVTFQGINLPNVAVSVGITNNSGAPGAYDITMSGGV